MKSHTYYDILGVSRDATLDEITTAKNALAKVYHPDANAHKNIDTTAFMQEILEAYQGFIESRKSAANITKKHSAKPNAFQNIYINSGKRRNTGSFVTYWNMSNQ